MALENEIDGTAPLETGTAQANEIQTPEQAATTPATQAQIDPALEAKRELQRIKSEQGRIAAQARRAQEDVQRLQAQNRELVMRDMTEVERLKFERDEAYGFANATQAQLQDQERERARQADLQQIAETTGAPVEELQDAESPQAAWAKAVDYMKRQSQPARAAAAERSEANAVYLGGGAPSTPTTRQEQRYQQLMRERNADAYVLDLLNGR